MKHKVRLTCLIKPWRFNYSEDMVVFSVTRDSVEVRATLEDAVYLQRINTQHEVDIYSVNDKCYFPLWFFRKFEVFITADPTKEWGKAYFYYLTERGQPYEPSHPIVDQAPAFIYQPSQKFLNKKKDIVVSRLTGYKAVDHSTLTITELKEYLTNIFVTRSNKQRRQVKIGIYCPHVGHCITVGPDYWPCSECYYERVGKHLHEGAQNYLKADKYYGKTNKA
jgi:hypothetical protein